MRCSSWGLLLLVVLSNLCQHEGADADRSTPSILPPDGHDQMRFAPTLRSDQRTVKMRRAREHLAGTYETLLWARDAYGENSEYYIHAQEEVAKAKKLSIAAGNDGSLAPPTNVREISISPQIAKAVAKAVEVRASESESMVDVAEETGDKIAAVALEEAAEAKAAVAEVATSNAQMEEEMQAKETVKQMDPKAATDLDQGKHESAADSILEGVLESREKKLAAAKKSGDAKGLKKAEKAVVEAKSMTEELAEQRDEDPAAAAASEGVRSSTKVDGDDATTEQPRATSGDMGDSVAEEEQHSETHSQSGWLLFVVGFSAGIVLVVAFIVCLCPDLGLEGWLENEDTAVKKSSDTASGGKKLESTNSH